MNNPMQSIVAGAAPLMFLAMPMQADAAGQTQPRCLATVHPTGSSACHPAHPSPLSAPCGAAQPWFRRVWPQKIARPAARRSTPLGHVIMESEAFR